MVQLSIADLLTLGVAVTALVRFWNVPKQLSDLTSTLLNPPPLQYEVPLSGLSSLQGLLGQGTTPKGSHKAKESAEGHYR